MNNARFYGNKPYNIAVIHGGPGALGSVAAIARELSKEYGVIEPLQSQKSIAELLNELDKVLSGSSNLPVILIGHSWGAWLAFIYAAQYQEKVKKVILIGSGPFEMKYVSDITKNRMKHLSDKERKEFGELLEKLNIPQTDNKDNFLKRLSEFVNRTDNYCSFEIETDKVDCFPPDGEMYTLIWNEASKLRENGNLLKLAEKIKCPVIAIHGEFDPHPVNGVKIPLEARLQDFTHYTIKKCGHYPWKEKHAYKRFYEILKKELE